MAERMRVDRLVDAGADRGAAAGVPDGFVRDGVVRPTRVSARKHPAIASFQGTVIDAELLEQNGAEWDVAGLVTLVLGDAQHHAFFVDVLRAHAAQLGPAHAGRVERHQDGAVTEVRSGVLVPGRPLAVLQIRRGEAECVEKTEVESGTVVRVRCGGLIGPIAVSIDGSTLYYVEGPTMGYEIRSAQPENGPFRVIGTIPAGRIPGDQNLWQVTLSPDGNWLAAPLVDKGATNLWMMPAAGGSMRQLTDFAQRSILIMRRISWSPDSKFLFAAVNEYDADIVLLDGMFS